MCFHGLTPSTPRKLLALLSAGALALGLNTSVAMPAMAQNVSTSTPIKHVVVIFQENVSFDHYFATYPLAQNPAGDPQFHASRSTPSQRARAALNSACSTESANKELAQFCERRARLGNGLVHPLPSRHEDIRRIERKVLRAVSSQVRSTTDSTAL